MQRTLSEIWIYPVKGMGGVRLKETSVLEKGLPGDRRMMVVDSNNCFLSQRTHPVLALLKVRITGDGYVLSFGNGRDLLTVIPDAFQGGAQKQVVVMDDEVVVQEGPREYSEWISSHLKTKCTLVCFPEEGERRVDPHYAVNDESVSLADAFPFLLIGQASLDDLNSRLTTALPMNRFRPNLVVKGALPYEEDTWYEIQIGNSRFAAVKPCSRCRTTTVDQETGLTGQEPLRTLASYRSDGNNAHFGQNLVALECNEIAEGDVITVQSFRQHTGDRTVAQ